MVDTILVTGGNRGIGLAICRLLAKQGKKVLMGCRDITQGKEVCQHLEGTLVPVKLDLSRHMDVEQQIINLVDEFGTPQGLINNAAILREGNLLQVAKADFYQTMQTNLFAPFELCRYLLPAMIKQNYGRIVNVTSSWGAFSQGMEGPAAYAISKAALNALTLSLSRDVPQNVKINAMDPGWVRTDMGGSEAPTSPEQAAETAAYLMNLDNSGPSGRFFRDKREIPW